jgi:hypothetical protein
MSNPNPSAGGHSLARPALILIVTVGLLMALLVVVRPAEANPSGALGVNGTVKIHEDEPEPDPEIKNQPHVCTFHVHGFNFDQGETGRWWIQGWPPTGGPPDADPANAVMGPEPYVANENDGANQWEWRTTTRTLPDGHYKLFVEQTHTTGNGDVVTTYKHKVFWVECGQGATPTPTPTPGQGGGNETPTPTPTPEQGGGGATPTPTPEQGGGGATPTPTPEQGAGGGTPTPTPESGVQGSTGTPAAGQVPNTATSPMSGSGTSMVLVFGLLFAGSLGCLTWTTVVARRRR